MADTSYTPEDLEEADREPEPDVEAPDARPGDHSDDFDPSSPSADAPAVF